VALRRWGPAGRPRTRPPRIRFTRWQWRRATGKVVYVSRPPRGRARNVNGGRGLLPQVQPHVAVRHRVVVAGRFGLRLDQERLPGLLQLLIGVGQLLDLRVLLQLLLLLAELLLDLLLDDVLLREGLRQLLDGGVDAVVVLEKR